MEQGERARGTATAKHQGCDAVALRLKRFKVQEFQNRNCGETFFFFQFVLPKTVGTKFMGLCSHQRLIETSVITFAIMGPVT